MESVPPPSRITELRGTQNAPPDSAIEPPTNSVFPNTTTFSPSPCPTDAAASAVPAPTTIRSNEASGFCVSCDLTGDSPSVLARGSARGALRLVTQRTGCSSGRSHGHRGTGSLEQHLTAVHRHRMPSDVPGVIAAQKSPGSAAVLLGVAQPAQWNGAEECLRFVRPILDPVGHARRER